VKLAKPDIAECISRIEDSDRYAGQYYERKATNYATRHCLWAGQSEDGRKHREALGREPFPWDGASDARVRLADAIINRNVNLLKKATLSARLQCQPVESSDAPQKVVVETVLKWLVYTHCLQNLHRELEIGANICEENGLVVYGVFWERITRTEMQSLAFDALVAMYQEESDPALGAMLMAISNPLEEETAAELLEGFLPGHGTRAAVRALRDTGVYEYENPYIFRNAPKLVALEPWEDIYFPVTACDLQSQPHVTWRELVEESELRARILTEDYDEAFVEAAVEHKGKRLRESQWWTRGKSNVLYSEDDDERIEIFHQYRKEITKENAERVLCTVIHPSVPDRFGKNELIPYAHGQYPFIEIPRERTNRILLDSRGVPEILISNQEDMKRQRDYRNDRAALAINPPLRVPTNRGKLAILMGPRAEIPERRQGEIAWMAPPPYDAGSLESEKSSRRDANEYFGRMDEGVDPTEAGLAQGDMVLNWLTGFKLIFDQMLALSQQYMTDDEVTRIAGTLPAPFALDRANIQGRYDLTVEFDPMDLDNERLGAKLDYIAKVILPMDVAGVVDRAGLVKFVMSAVDPKMAEMFVRPAEAATASEAADEQDKLALLWAGIEPPLAQPGQNAQVRLGVIQAQLQANPQWAERMQGDELFGKMLGARAQSFQFQLQQQENAQIGRVGAAPVLAGGGQGGAPVPGMEAAA